MKPEFSYNAVLTDTDVLRELLRAWQDSKPGSARAREEGGFVVWTKESQFRVIRWESGEQDRIVLPEYKDGKFENAPIIASFHTHPNIGAEYQQEPGITDCDAVRDDHDLKTDFYIGEFVISHETIYLISPNGFVSEVADTVEVFSRARNS